MENYIALKIFKLLSLKRTLVQTERLSRPEIKVGMAFTARTYVFMKFALEAALFKE